VRTTGKDEVDEAVWIYVSDFVFEVPIRISYVFAPPILSLYPGVIPFVLSISPLNVAES